MTRTTHRSASQADSPTAHAPDRNDAGTLRVPIGVASVLRAVAVGGGALFLGLGALLIVLLFARPLAVFVLGVALAESLAPAVNRLERWLPRPLGVILIYAALLLTMAGIGWVTIPALVAQTQDAITRIPDLVERAQQRFPGLNSIDNADLPGLLTSAFGQIGAALVSLPVGVAGAVLGFVLLLFVSIYWLIEAPTIHRFFLSLFPRSRQEEVGDLVHEIGQAMGGYIRGSVLNGVIVGTLVYIGLLAFRIEYALVLGLLAGILEVIPVLGPIIAGVLMTGFALLQSPAQALVVLAFVVILQQLENHILVPNIMRTQTEVSPLLVVLALFAGGAVGGLLGALVAIPLVAAGRVFVMRVVAPAVRRFTGAGADEAQDGSDGDAAE